MNPHGQRKVAPKLRLLVVSPTFPYPLISGGKQRVFFVLREFSRDFEITLLSLAEPGDVCPESDVALSFLNGLETCPVRQNRLAQLTRLALRVPRWIGGSPAEVLVKQSPQFLRRFKKLAASGRFDAVLIEYSQLLDFVPVAQAAGLPVATTAHDVSFVAQNRKAQVSTGFSRWLWSRESRLMRKHELRGWRQADTVFAMSDYDRAQIAELAPETAVRTMPNGVDTEKLQPVAEADDSTIIFVGWMRHFPNRDAAEWLLRSIWPEIRRLAPGARLQICGGGMPDELIQLAAESPGVAYLGHVKHIDRAVGSATLSIVPIRAGSGSRLKILESMALGTPVVSTTVGCEGILVNPNQDILVENDAAALARATVKLLADPVRRKDLAVNARRLVEQQYDWRNIGKMGHRAILEMLT